MLLSKRTPLAWYNLTHDWRKLAVALAGIGFAVLLMFMQVGFQNALFDSQVKMIDELAGDIFLVSRAKFTLASEKRFPLEMIKRASSCAGVAGAYPVYTDLTFSRLKNLSVNNAGKGYPIRSIGFHLTDPVFKASDINSQLERLRPPGTALIDMHSKRENFDFPYDDDVALEQIPVELGERGIRLVGTFDLGTDFAHDGNLVMSAENFALYLPQRQSGDPLSVVDIGIVRLQEGASIDDVRQAIDDMLDDRIWVFTREQFRNAEISFWDDSTPIGIVFAAGKVIGFVVGMVICYQVIYSDIADHMPEFATLKAMGYSSRYFMGLIVAEAVLLSLIGFLPGLAISTGLYVRVASATGLLMRMTPDVMALVLLLTVAMCIASGMLAVRKLLAADPATLF